MQIKDRSDCSPICPHLHFLCKDEILQGNSVAQDFRPRLVAIALDLTQVLRAEQDPTTISREPRGGFAIRRDRL